MIKFIKFWFTITNKVCFTVKKGKESDKGSPERYKRINFFFQTTKLYSDHHIFICKTSKQILPNVFFSI